MAVAPATYQQPRASRSGRTLIFVIGAGMALLAFVAVFVVGIVLSAGNSASRQVTAVVAVRDIQPRELITTSSVALSQVSSAALPPHAIVRLADLVGDTALVTIYKGQVIGQNVIAASPDQIDEGSQSYLPIPQGFVAMAIPTNELQGVAGYPSAGDYINIIATVNVSLLTLYNGQVVNRSTGTVTRTVFTSIRIIRVGPPTVGPKTGQQQGVVASLTIILSECDAQYLDWLTNNATLKYVLLSYKDYAPPPATADSSCPPTGIPGVVGPKQVNSRWDFTKG
jgi:Flp pilus assembly protein CpaB